jgi:release factor glutamine methyltransferase
MNGSERGANPAGDSARHHPILSAAAIARIWEWHEAADRGADAEADSGQMFTYLGKTLVVPPQVHPITGVEHLLGEAVLAEVREGDRVLDMGTGSGLNAVLAASQGAHVVAVDINPDAVEAARQNAERSGLADQIEVHQSDVFSDVVGRFDVIVYDPPFRRFAPSDVLGATASDDNHRALLTFLRNARHYLARMGRVLIFFGISGDLAYMKQLANQEGFTAELVAQEGLLKNGWRVDCFAFRLTP